jgi:hypothetical protein
MRTIEKTVYSFSELNDEQKQVAVDKLRDINVDHEWYEWTVGDAKDIGLAIDTFDLYRRDISGEFIDDGQHAAGLIVKEHGEGCETHKLAQAYLTGRAELVKKYSDGINTELVDYDKEDEFDSEIEEFDKEFLHELLEEYLAILRREEEYLTSDEAIIETIEANEYEFNEDGSIY